MPAKTAAKRVPRPRESFTVNAELQAHVDGYARKHGLSSAEAVQKFFCDGMEKCLEEDFEADLAAYEAEMPGIRESLATSQVPA